MPSAGFSAGSCPLRLQPGFSFANFAFLLLVMPRRRGVHSRHVYLFPGARRLLAVMGNAASELCPSLRALNSLGQGEAPEAQLSKFPRFFFLLKSQPGAELS